VEGSYVLQAAVGATGAKTATSAPSAADQGNAHILALRPSCATVADASYVAGAAPTGASPSVTVYWSSGNAPLILRKSGTAFAGNHVPVHGTSYTAGQRPWGSAATDPYVIYNGSAAMTGITCDATSCTDASTGGTGLSNGTTYYYKVFPKNGTCYASGIGADINLTPVASGHSWSYTLAGGSMLKAGIAGEGAIYTGSNANRIVSVSTTNGTQTWAPVGTGDAVQGWLSWIFISNGTGSERAVIGGDQSATVYSVNPATGATYWTKDLSANGADAIHAPAAAQLFALSDSNFQLAHSTDLVFVATRNASTTNNKVFALRVSDGSVAWTFNGTGTSNVDYIVGQPWVDRTTNRLYVTSRAGGGSQASLWVLSTLNGALEASFPLGHIENSPTLSSTGATLWVANTSGQLYAINTVSLTQKWTSPAALGSAVKGFVWEDFITAGRLYFSTADGNVWCLQDPGAGSPPNPASPVWKTLVAGASMPLLLNSLYVGSSDGRVHELNLITGVDAKQFTLAGTVGDLSTENGTEVFAPTSAGKIYKIPVPLP
jgi:outer membrane protein assembly factor BamB